MAKRATHTRRRKGRPPGATNRQFAHALELPATCPTCGSEELHMIGGKPVTEQAIAGTVLGQTFDLVRWRDTKCAKCGQHVRVRQYLRKTAEQVQES